MHSGVSLGDRQAGTPAASHVTLLAYDVQPLHCGNSCDACCEVGVESMLRKQTSSLYAAVVDWYSQTAFEQVAAIRTPDLLSALPLIVFQWMVRATRASLRWS